MVASGLNLEFPGPMRMLSLLPVQFEEIDKTKHPNCDDDDDDDDNEENDDDDNTRLLIPLLSMYK